MSEESPLQDKFQKFEDPTEIFKFLQEGSKTLSETLIWTKNQEQIIQTYCNGLDGDTKCIHTWCPKTLSGMSLKTQVDQTGQNEFYFNLSLPAANLFFKTNLVSGNDTSLQFLIPNIVYKLQRRSYLRLKITNDKAITLWFKDPIFTESKIHKQILDLSAGGLSFSILEQEESLYFPGMKLQGIEFMLQKKTILCEGEVRYFKPLKTHTELRGIKIGVRFLQLQEKDSQHIARFVFEENRKYLVRFL